MYKITWLLGVFISACRISDGKQLVLIQSFRRSILYAVLTYWFCLMGEKHGVKYPRRLSDIWYISIENKFCSWKLPASMVKNLLAHTHTHTCLYVCVCIVTAGMPPREFRGRSTPLNSNSPKRKPKSQKKSQMAQYKWLNTT